MVANAIPTRYRSVQFRSRLEAKWAACFDLLGWPWEYEPIDLNGYIPDFVLGFHRPLLVEVKPALTLEELVPHRKRIEASGWQHEALIVGARWWDGASAQCSYSDEAPVVGDVGEGNGVGWGWDRCELFHCLECGKPSLVESYGYWQCKRSGCYSGNNHIGVLSSAQWYWHEAGNRVQWRAPCAG